MSDAGLRHELRNCIVDMTGERSLAEVIARLEDICDTIHRTQPGRAHIGLVFNRERMRELLGACAEVLRRIDRDGAA